MGGKITNDFSSTAGLGVGRWSWRPGDGHLVCSDGVLSLLKLPLDHPADWECWLEHVHPADQDMVRRSLLPLVDRREHRQSFEYRLIRDDGSTIYIEDRRHWDAGGDCQGIFIDVTETATREHKGGNAGIYTQVVDAADIGAYFYDFESGQEYWNEAFQSIFGMEGSSFLPAPDRILQFIHPEDVDRIRRHVAASRTSDSTLDIEYRIVQPVGEHRWIRERGYYLRTADGQLRSYYGALQDITDEKRRMADLEESRRLLELALETNDMGVWEINWTTGQQVWSDQFYRILGYNPDDIAPTQERWLAALHPDDRQWASDVFDTESKNGVHAFTYRIIAAGKVRWIRESWKDFTRADGARIRVGVTADTTDWKEREHRHEITEGWLTLAVGGGRIGLWSRDSSADRYHWNTYMFSLLGYQPGEVEPTAQAWYDRIHPADTERVRRELQQGTSDEREVAIEYRVLLSGNLERWLEERGSAEQKGSSVRHGVLFDITDQKLFQHELEASRQRLQLALDTGDMGFWSGHEDTEEWDDQTYRILGLERFSATASRETLLGIIHPEDRQQFTAREDGAMRRGDELIHEYRIVLPDGAIRWIESRRRHAPGENPDRYGVVRDVTDHKVREGNQLRSQRLDAAGQLLRGLAHDFNNFLAVISATLEPLGEMQHIPETARRLFQARHAVTAAALFSRRLINISKHREWQPQTLSLGEEVSRLAGIMKPLMKVGIDLSVKYPEELWTVYVDPLECDSAVINLLINARDAIHTAGSITITVSNLALETESTAPELRGEYVVLKVRDTGRGMDTATLRMATEPFFTTKPEGSGTGLGLSSVVAFTTAAHGFLTIDSEPGSGTSVSLHLPRAHEATQTATPQAGGAQRGAGELVLVVDDEPFMREITMQRVEALGYAVEEAMDAESALQALRTSHGFALVLSDISMPGPLNGLGLRDRIAAEMPHISVVLITAHEDLADSAGPSPILSKFCSQSMLAEALAAALATKRPHKLA